MKILLATYWPIPHLGGVWPFMLQIKRRLELLGHTVDLMGNGPDTPKYHIVFEDRELLKAQLLPMLDAKLNESAVPVLHLDSWVQTVEKDRYCMELAAAYFGVDQYDIIHTQDVIATRALSRVKRKDSALVANIHGSLAREVMMALERDHEEGYRETLMWKYYWALEHYGALSADITITSTEWMKQTLVREFEVPEQQIATFQYGLDTERFWEVQAKGTDMTRPEGKKVIICPSRLVYIKGLHYLISALGLLKARRTDWVCWIVGEGDKREELQTQAKELGLVEEVVFLGHREDVPALLQLADIFVHPSIQDNQPFSVMEAQVSGLPAVVSNAGGLPEMVEHERTGLVSLVGDVEALAAHLQHLLAQDDVRMAMGNRAKTWGTAHWSLDVMIARLVGIYGQALNQVL
ncbi:glycosyltransferase family 4 protein [Paenibacillus sp. 23TSA30-6]|uniref:glycosyltransferase family 4 protein n=1 Tax=Paenibacillus sp. 23TSA30-6 TaxID=2546104 RepID=UPI0017889EB5|nr:glycosyltransferase family 4 protein [Paenibacillus sp. 23TSA30-6]MBE0335670.1 glycosyltransferase family 1 protein [Paenibacillus sp. 23TSA30-6]